MATVRRRKIFGAVGTESCADGSGDRVTALNQAGKLKLVSRAQEILLWCRVGTA